MLTSKLAVELAGEMPAEVSEGAGEFCNTDWATPTALSSLAAKSGSFD